MVESHMPFILILVLSLTQGTTSQNWGTNLDHDQICAVTGSSVAMSCSFTHPPDVMITKVFWVVNPVKGQESSDMSDNPEYRGRVMYSADIGKNCTLVLNQVKPTDAHMYHARLISNKKTGKWLSSGVQLLVTDLTVQVHGPVVEGRDAELICISSCTLKDNTPLVWKRNGNVLPEKQIHNKKLILKNVKTEDEGHYSCALKDREGIPSQPVKVNVMFSPKNAKLTSTPSNALLEGGSVTLTCSSDANPPVQPQEYRWFKKNLLSSVRSGKQYSINNIRSDDGGWYYCEARNDYGAEKSSAVLITVEAPPKHTSVSVSPSGDLLEGTTVNLTCSSDANPPMERYIWFYNNGSITSHVGTGKDYIIGHGDREHNGDYYCEAKNKHGAKNSTNQKLDFHYAPENTSASLSPSAKIMKGGSVNMTCNSEANPPVESYTWFKVDEFTPVGSGQEYSITNISSEDGGQYYCQATNKHGAQNSTAVLITVEEDNTLMFYIMIGGSSGGGLLCLLCVACFIRVWCRSEKPDMKPEIKTKEESIQRGINDYGDCMNPVYHNFEAVARNNDFDDDFEDEFDDEFDDDFEDDFEEEIYQNV